MRQNEVVPKFREYSNILTEIFNYISTNGSLDGLMECRGYTDPDMLATLEDMQVARIMEAPEEFASYPEELKLLNKSGDFLLNGRYVVPIYAPNGREMLSLVGYYPDLRKYITLATPFFSRRVVWFNYANAVELAYSSPEWDGCCVALEGIFDVIALRSKGIPAIGTMGAVVSDEKAELLKVFKKVLAIPDADKAGRRGIEGAWHVPSNTKFLKLIAGAVEVGDDIKYVKDMDDFVLLYDDVEETLLECLHDDKKITTLDLR